MPQGYGKKERRLCLGERVNPAGELQVLKKGLNYLFCSIVTVAPMGLLKVHHWYDVLLLGIGEAVGEVLWG